MTKTTLRRLSEEARLPVDAALERLMRAGELLGLDPRAPIPRSKIYKCRVLLGLPRKPQDPTEVSHLAVQAGLPEAEVREKLIAGDCLPKRRLCRVPKSHLSKAMELLGLGVKPPPMQMKQPASDTTKKTRKRTKKKEGRKKGKRTIWKTIGPPQEMEYLTASDIEEIHWVLVEDFATTKAPIAPPGVRDPNLLAGASIRPRTALSKVAKYPSVSMASGALLHAIVHDHAFHNGNKRTAIVSLLVFLDKNGWLLTADQDELYDYILDLAKHELLDRDKAVIGADAEALHAARWVQARVRRIRRGERPLQFRQLRSILLTYGCQLSSPRPGNKINIVREDKRTQVGYRNEGTEVARNTIHKVRLDLGLDEAGGYDSDIFYNKGPRISEFISKHRGLLSRLAKV